MNIIHSEKLIWILAERTGTRAIGQLLNFWDVEVRFQGYPEILPKNYNDGEFSQQYRHDWYGDWEVPDYPFVITMRNPYSRILSYYKSLHLKLDCQGEECQYTFSEFLDKVLIGQNRYTSLQHEKLFKERDVKHVVKLESMKIDLMNIPMIEKKFKESQEFRDTWKRVISDNKFTKESEDNDSKITESDAEIIYDVFQDQFNMFGYSKDSWRYL